MKKIFTLLILLLSVHLFAQEPFNVKGFVTDSIGEPIIGAEISIKGTNLGTISDIEGRFELNIPADSSKILLFKYYSYLSQELEAKNQMTVVLKEDSTVLSEVVFIGYGTIKKKDLIEARSLIETNTPPKSVTVSLNDTTAVKPRIRGYTSLSSANNPEYVVDGVSVDDISDLNPYDIESIEILKIPHDPPCYSACPSSKGIILITTKSVKYDLEVMDIGYNTFLATQSPKEFYSLSTLKAKNRSSVTEWNLRYQNPLQYSADIYGSGIDYDSNVNYGLDFEYKLYMFFQYMEKEFNVKLI